MVQACIQCGTCSGSCPNTFAMDHTPRKLWRMVLGDQAQSVLASKTFILCSSCYTCTLRCPRGLPLTEAMARLVQLARKANPLLFKKSHAFYDAFLQSVKNHGRVNEAGFMTHYFFTMKDPLLPLKFTPLGVKLMRKGKVAMPAFNFGLGRGSRPRGKMAAIFEKIRQMEQHP
ncbi:MAG: heterodisulfide reductase [Desulfobacteraceae bacterium]|nr:MAG: heterodisulfide reductase [Desulfobacteraceae bacterium]